MQPTITAIRAVGAAFVIRTLQPLISIGALVIAALLALGGWLTTHSAWWWLLEVMFILGAILFALAVMVVVYIIRKLATRLTKPQRQAVDHFVDKLERVAGNLQTPQLLILYYVVRDIIRPRRDGFIETVSHDSASLASDFVKLRAVLDDTPTGSHPQ